jgi:hypothetical protein
MTISFLKSERIIFIFSNHMTSLGRTGDEYVSFRCFFGFLPTSTKIGRGEFFPPFFAPIAAVDFRIVSTFRITVGITEPNVDDDDDDDGWVGIVILPVVLVVVCCCCCCGMAR